MVEFFRRAWVTIQSQLEKLPASTKWLIGSLLVILLLVGSLVVQYAGQPDMVTLMPAGGEGAPIVLARLQSAGIKATTEGGQIKVPTENREEAYAVLAQEDLLTSNSAAALDEHIKSQTPWMTNQMNAQAFQHAKNKYLGLVISKMIGVRSADVFVDMPRQEGFGATRSRPTASVNVTMRNGQTMNKRLAGSIASWVSGTVSGLKPADVVIIDAGTGKQFKVHDEQDGLGGDSLEQIAALEQKYRDRVAELLGYIPGVIVAVNVRTDNVMRKSVSTAAYDKADVVVRERTKDTNSTSGAPGATPGVKPNTQVSIDEGGGTVSVDTSNETETEFGTKPLARKEDWVERGGVVKKVNVTVNVPRSFFVRLLKQGKADAPDPTDADIEKLSVEHLAQIAAQIKPIIEGEEAGEVAAYMVPDPGIFLAMSGGGEGFAPGGETAGGAGFLANFTGGSNSWVSTGIVAALAVFALLIMLNMNRKAIQQAPMPSIEELAGVPPKLPTLVEDELIGEAEATEPTMAGVELNESEIRTRKIADQIADLVKANPTEAAGLFNRWIRKEG